MSYVFVLPKEVVERLYTQCCDCFDFKKALTELEAVTKENNIEKLVKATFKFVSTYVKNLVHHTGRIPLLQKKPCRNKDFVLSNNLASVLKIHIELLNNIEAHLYKEKARKLQIIIPPDQSDLLELFGSPTIAKSIELTKYIELTKKFLVGTLNLYSELAKTFTPANPSILCSHLKLIVLTLRIFGSYLERSNYVTEPIFSHGSIKLELHSDTPL